MIFETDHLLLRKWQDTDAVPLYKLAKNPNIGPIAAWPVHTSVENSVEIIKTVLSAENTFALVLKQTNEIVGSIGLMTSKSKNQNIKLQDHEAEIGYWVGEPFWGQGFAPEAARVLIRYAFEDLQITTIWAGYFDGNEKSKRVQEKCGFTHHRTEYNYPVPLLNEHRTLHLTRITKSDWQKIILLQ
jgi:RimJ/RimL family protein N-acetyltransferase